MSRNDWIGMGCYFIVALLLGIDVAFVCLFVKENADRIAYYGGEWNKGDLARGCTAIIIGWAIDIVVRLLV